MYKLWDISIYGVDCVFVQDTKILLNNKHCRHERVAVLFVVTG